MSKILYSRMLFFYTIIIGILFLALFAANSFAFAQDNTAGPVRVNVTEREGLIVAEFWIRGRLLGRLPQGSSLDEFNARVFNWQRRLNDIFTKNTPINNIKDTVSGGSGIVLNGSVQILIFDAEMARLMKTTPADMAKSWGGNIRFALKTSPSFDIKTNQIVVPLNENFTLNFEGTFDGELSFYDYDPNIIQITPDKANNRITIFGSNLGKGLFRAKAEDIEKVVYFRVQERAGYAPAEERLAVTGNPASAAMIKQALTASLYYKSAAKDGAYVVIGDPLEKAQFKSLKPGETQNLIIPVKVAGEDYITSARNTRVTIENVPFNRQPAEILLLSNKPEVIPKDGELFSAQFKPKKPIRYFYHHYNPPDAPWRNLYLTLENTGATPARVYITSVGAGPSEDELFAGHLAASSYYDAKKSGTGWYITIRPKTKFLLEKRLIKTAQTVSGIGYLHTVEGEDVKLNVYSSTIPGRMPPENAKPHNHNPNVRTAKGVFPAYIQLKSVHIIGDRFTFIPLGENFQEEVAGNNPNHGNPNYGNYGSFYNIDITIENPRENDRDAWVYFVPGGGIARGIFDVDGQLLETGLVYPAQRVLLKKVRVASGGKEQVRIRTMPQGGAYYPVRIVVESEFVRPQQVDTGD